MRSLSAPTSSELLEARQELTDNLETLSDDLTDLTAVVDAVEKDPYKYGLDVADVAARRRFVQESAGEVEDMREEMSTAEVQHPNYGGFVGDSDDEEVDDSQVQFERQTQLEMMREQDVQLEGVSRTVGNLREQAHIMGRELEEQAEMVGALEEGVDRVQGKLNRGLRDLNKFIKKNEGESVAIHGESF